MFLRRGQTGLAAVFGALELRVLDALWRRGGESPFATSMADSRRRLHHADDDDGPAAPEGCARAARRSAARSSTGRSLARRRWNRALVARALQPLLQGDSAQPILSFLSRKSAAQDDQLLDELERLVREKRRKQEEEGDELYWLALARRRSLLSFAPSPLVGATAALRPWLSPGRWRAASRATRRPRARDAAVPAARAAGAPARRSGALRRRAADLPVVRAARQQRRDLRAHADRDGARGLALLARARAWRAAAAWRATAPSSRATGWRAAARLHGPRRRRSPCSPSTSPSRPSPSSASRVRCCSSPSACSASARADEVRAMVLHECAHVDAPRQPEALPDPRLSRSAAARSALDRAWTSGGGGGGRRARGPPAIRGFALELAQALIRVARLAPASGHRSMSPARSTSAAASRRASAGCVEPADGPAVPREPLGCVLAFGTCARPAGRAIVARPPPRFISSWKTPSARLP